ncbi:MAG TPA: hypothetical protein VKU02_02250 [Gemmataceae bacterium]|nr:hypothetical protein [Gemmataceae bacterium]
MDGVQAVDLIASWRRILIEGKAEQITSMLEDLEARLKNKGFERDAAAEKKMNWHPYQRNRVLCFVGGPEGGPRLLLCLNRVSEHRVRGGTYSLLDASSDADPVEVAAVVDDVIRNVIVPSTNSFGLKVTRPRLGPNSRVQPKTMAALVAFSDIATGGGLPLSEASETAWRKFLVTASQEDVAFDKDELMDWFVSNGWGSGDACTLTERFVREATLLAEYSEASGN